MTLVDKKVAKLSGQAAACRDAARVLSDPLSVGGLEYSYFANPYPSDENKEAFRREIERMVNNLYRRQQRLEVKLASAMGMHMTRTPHDAS